MTEHDEPRPPLARCGNPHCSSWLSFTRDFTGTWICACGSCSDADYDYERGRHYRTDPTGSGDSALDALVDYCEVHFDCGPEELMVLEPHV